MLENTDVPTRLTRGLAMSVAAAVLAACAVGPDYERPDIDMPDAWRVDYASSAELINRPWWQSFRDPVLDELIEIALQENQDIRIAAARVEQFLGALRSTRSRFFPQADYSGTASRNRVSEEGFVASPSADPYFTQYEAAGGAAWQIDLFGRIRRQTEAAQARVYATEQARRGVILSVVTAVAASYVNLLSIDRQLEISRATLDNYAGTLKIFEMRYSGGVVSKVELSQVQSEYERARAQVPNLEAQVEAQENLISILLGRDPGPILRGSKIGDLARPGVPSSLPSSLLDRRPDVVQAEQSLIAANADIGAAKSLYYPSISITGDYGGASEDLNDLLDSSARQWSIAGNITGPIFTAGAIAGQVQSAEAAREAALQTYELTVLNALREVNDALIASQKSLLSYEALARRVESLREYARLSYLKFENGAASYLEVLYANNLLFDSELIAVQAQARTFTNLIDIYKAMGGGWVGEAVGMAPTPDEVMSGN
jgi:multidrug efflux system outer membrane protein